MKTIVAMMLIAVASAAAGQSIDASSCESAASRLKSAAGDLEDAAEQLDDTTRREIQYAESDVRSKAGSVLSEMSSIQSSCDARGPAIPVNMVHGVIVSHLLARFGDTPSTRAKVERIDGDLMALAKTHVRVRPADFRMTLAVAELVYLDDSSRP